MTWNIEYTDEFGAWWQSLPEDEQVELDASVQLLEEFGPGLGRPHCDTIQGAKYTNMKELRTQCRGRPLRTFFAFDPRRTAILLIGGDKTGDDRFYERMIPLAEQLYDNYLEELRMEGLI
ncbi:MAG: addiction module toxin RelE [Candidatus Electrothrix sp. MAN1_4]|nr:addiction module toxin RelE [Candidatus Electrothrix sp. MAN1_4]